VRAGFYFAGAEAVGNEVESVFLCAVGECAGGFYVALCGVAVPSVDLVMGVVGHEGECAVGEGEDGAGVGFALEGAGGDAAATAGDVVCEDGEVR